MSKLTDFKVNDLVTLNIELSEPLNYTMMVCGFVQEDNEVFYVRCDPVGKDSRKCKVHPDHLVKLKDIGY